MANHMDEYSIPPELARFPAACEHALNTRDLGAVQELFAPNAMRVVSPGTVQAGEQLWRAAGRTLADLPPIKMSVRHTYRVGDTALLIIDYVHEGTLPDGQPVRVEGTAADVVRRGTDGVWRCLISNPAGTSAGE